MEAKETNHPSSNPLSSRSTNSEEQKDQEGGQEQDISAHDGQESNYEVSLRSTPILSSFASYNMADMRFECEVLFNSTASLKLALELLLRCGSSKITRLRRNIIKIDYKDFHELTFHFESTIEHVKWLVSIFSAIVSNKVPNIELHVGNIINYWLQTQISVLNADDSKHSDRVAVANVLRDLARENEENKQLIVNEGAVPALLNVLKRPSFESQFAAISTLVTLASHYESIPTIVFKDFLPVIVDLLSNSSEAMQIQAASFVALLAGRPSLAEGFWKLDTVPPFVRFLLKSNINNYCFLIFCLSRDKTNLIR